MRAISRKIGELLVAGHRVALVGGGGSMAGVLEHGDGVVLAPCHPADIVLGDVVYTRVGRRYFLHMVVGVQEANVLIGDTWGHLNGWTPRERCFGIVREVHRGGFSEGKALPATYVVLADGKISPPEAENGDDDHE